MSSHTSLSWPERPSVKSCNVSSTNGMNDKSHICAKRRPALPKGRRLVLPLSKIPITVYSVKCAHFLIICSVSHGADRPVTAKKRCTVCSTKPLSREEMEAGVREFEKMKPIYNIRIRCQTVCLFVVKYASLVSVIPLSANLCILTFLVSPV